MARAHKASETAESEKTLTAILAVLVADREERIASSSDGGKDARKTEVILAASGLSPAEIAPLVGKNVGAVRKTIQRGKGK